ncbi:choline transporter-like protein 1 [Plakobranchus ocellatus]|uniref:Choline transporter-like protein n=1 Tax=Plakobranchus ocellatus TaxID=259542 RepID=A0AAV4AV65_9GAST|nr:choline transporter-like protein 1 [Plakobranchus ocellatus]
MVLIIRFVASFAVWIITTLAVLTSCVGTAFLWWTFMGNKQKLDFEESQNIPLLEVDIFSENTFLAFSVIASVLTLILLSALVINRRRLALVTGLLQEAGNCVSGMPLLLLQPLWTFLLLLVFFIYWVTVLAYLCTAEKPSVTEHGYVTYHEHEIVTHFWWYHLVGLFWVSEYIVACQSFVISGAVARWYFTRDKTQLGFPMLGNIGRLIIFHQGSVALGSFIIPLLRFPRALLFFVNRRFRGSRSSCVCLGLKYLSASSYTVVAIGGKNFCTSARKSYSILKGNALQMTSIGGAADFVLLLSKLTVMIGTASLSVLWFKSQKDFHFYAIPVLLVCVLSYFIAHCFISVYEMILNALLLCFCEDRDLNDGSVERPYFGSRSLMIRLLQCSEAVEGVPRQERVSRLEPETEPAQV